jgi:hypothetical protein
MAAGAGLAAMGMPAGYAALSVGAASAATNGGDMKKAILNGFSAYTGAGLADSFMGAGAAMQSGTATSWMGGEAPVTAAVPTVDMAPSAGNLAGASQQEAINQAGMYRGPSYAAEAGNVSLASAAPAEVAQAAAAATPAAQAAQQAASLDTMNMSQRFDALKAGASGTNAMNYIKANPFASLGTATAMLTPDENKTPQKAADTDRGPRAGMRYYPGYGTSLPAPNMQGVEQTFNRPYYAAKGGVTRMATGGITSAPRNQQQLFADYLQRVSSSGVAATPPTNKYDWWKNPNDPAPAAPAPAETAEEYAARMRVNARGGGGGKGEREPEDPNSFSAQWAAMDDAEKEAWRAENPKSAIAQDVVTLFGSPLKFAYDKLQAYMGPESSTGGPARFARTPVVPNENDEPGDRYAPAYSPTLSPSSLDPAQQAKALAGYTSAQFNGATNNVRYQYAGKEISAAEAKALVDQGKYPTVVSDATSANEAAARIQGDLNPYTSSQFSAGEPAGYTSSQFSAGEPAGYTSSQFSAAALPSTPYASGRNSNYSPLTSGYTTPEARPVPSSSLTPSDVGAPSTEPAGGPIGIGYPDYRAVTPAAEGTPYGTSPVPPGVSANQFAANYAAYNNSYAPSVPYQDTKFVEGKESPSTLMYGPNPGLVANADSYAQESGLSGVPPGISYNNFVRNYEAYNNPKTTLNVTPDIVGINEISADPDADKTAESLGIPDAATFAAMLGAPFAQTAALNNGVVSDASVSGDPALAGYQGMYNPGYATPNMGYGRGALGTIGGVWRSADGTPVRTGDGSPLMTGAGAEAQAQQDARVAAFDAGRGGGDRNSVTPGGGSSDASSNTGNFSAGYGREGQHAAAGGLSTPYGFQHMAQGGMSSPYDLGSYSDGGRLLKGPGDGVSDSIPATIGKGRPARLADGEFVIPARIVSEIGNGSTDAGARKLYAMMDRIQAGRKKSVGKGKVAVNSRADKHLPA